jgi:hypothetical protein
MASGSHSTAGTFPLSPPFDRAHPASDRDRRRASLLRTAPLPLDARRVAMGTDAKDHRRLLHSPNPSLPL